MTDQPDNVAGGGGQQPPAPGGGLGGDPTWLHRHDRPHPPADAPAAEGTDAEAVEVEAEIVDPDDISATTADELLAEVFDADQLEADLAAVESEAQTVADGAAAAGIGSVSTEVAGLTADLQRVQAEFRNYKRRVERDREKENQRAVEKALAALLPVLDDLELADQHGELVGGFKSVAEKLVGTLAGLGLTAFGTVGEPFDPVHHEALMRESVDGIDEPTVVRVLQVGYEMNGRIIRAARVSVAGTD